jgi:hypothetical protein
MRWNACGIGSRPAGRASYGKRKQIVEPVFGIITAGTRFRQFLLRGIEAVRVVVGDTMAWNIRRMDDQRWSWSAPARLTGST